MLICSEIEENTGVTIVHLEVSKVDASNSGRVRDAVCAEMTTGKPNVLDLSDIEFIDSSGLGAIVAIASRAEESSTPFSLAAAPPAVVRLFELVNLNAKVAIFDQVSDAIDSFDTETH